MRRYIATGIMFGAAAVLAACSGGGGRAIQVTGSSTIYPFTKLVADAFVAADTTRKPPVIESNGTGAGIKRFCDGAGGGYPDIVDASRRMHHAEFDRCEANKVGEIVEVPIGLDGIAFAESNAGPKLSLTRKDLYLALAANPRGKPNTAKTWRDVNAALPAIPIVVLGPPNTSGTRDSLVELVLEAGCIAALPEAAAMRAAPDPAPFDKACRQIRTDGAYVAEGENDEAIVQALEQRPQAVGLFGFSYLDEHKAQLRGVPIDGVVPEAATIASGKYPCVRTLYLYAKKKHLAALKALPAFLTLYSTMWGPGGPLAKHGLIAAPQNMRDRAAEAIKLQLPLDQSALT